ncbi:MAG: hypothetical protein A2060_01280 [Planctomycetes bacterium GWA2_50_13]|nr:MAG: hypothetical protein A2060_01280 [Planctomycetes bacterium GWA2_50_13]OHB95429.1 MAG: hypothetical protein A3I59_04910 [Planctomycetes bacterium RIFCSPLOWO2_02_FULL_50_16]HKZ46755.1 DUF2283 domain-containing protein [Thermodesulfobacteriota bacterium]
MRIKVDLESDALYFRLSEDEIEESEEVTKGIIIDYSKAGKVIGVEILNVKERFTLDELSKLNVELPTVAVK